MAENPYDAINGVGVGNRTYLIGYADTPIRSDVEWKGSRWIFKQEAIYRIQDGWVECVIGQDRENDFQFVKSKPKYLYYCNKERLYRIFEFEGGSTITEIVM